MGIIAARMVHWLMLLETMFINAIGALVTRRAQLNVETNSGNSERNGAIHCTRKNWLMPSIAPPTANRPPMAAFCRHPGRRKAQRDTAGAPASDSASRGGFRIRIHRYP